jgi:hypothetical protein
VDTDERSPAVALYGLAMALGGLVLFLCAVDVIPAGDGMFNAPRWLVALVALLIAGAGAYMLAMPFTTAAQKAVFGGALALGFFTVMGTCFTWVLLANATGRGTLSIAGIPIPMPEIAERWFNRLFVGAFALLIDGVAIFGWWRLLTGRWRSLVYPPR